MKVTLQFDIEIDSEDSAMPKFTRRLLNDIADDVSTAVCEHESIEGCAVTSRSGIVLTVDAAPTQTSAPAPGFTEVIDSGEPVKFDMDGEQWCATRASFVNLAESPAGFGDTPMQALASLLANEQ